MISNLFRKKAHSKKGFTLVEAMCSVMILAIVTVGVLNAVAFSREMIYSNNARDKAADKAQLVADEIVSAVTGIAPTAGDEAYRAIDSKVNAIANDSTGADVQARSIGNVIRVGDDFSPPTNDSDPMIQYKLTARDIDSDEEVTQIMPSGDTDSNVEVTVVESLQTGWDIQVRVYYKQIGGRGDYKVVDFSAFAPVDVAASE